MGLAQSLSEPVLLPSPPNSRNTGQHLIPALLCSLVYQARWLPWLPSVCRSVFQEKQRLGVGNGLGMGARKEQRTGGERKKGPGGRVGPWRIGKVQKVGRRMGRGTEVKGKARGVGAPACR